MIRSKICGITNLEDALLCCQLGADALGFVFFPDSPRYIAPEQAQKIIRQLPAFVSAVGLFVNADQQTVEATLQQVSLDILQFHGDEAPEFCGVFARPYIKAIRVQTGQDILNAQAQYPQARALLFDAHSAHAYGGTGQTFDWTLLPEALTMPWILSGGLNADNISEAITRTKTQAVDISSGVERQKGVKCPEKLLRFFKGIHDAR